MTFAVDSLPEGLSVDSATGRITGALAAPGDYTVVLRAANSAGSARRTFHIKVGGTIGLTPPMGWNSYNVWDQAITQEVALESARLIKAQDLDRHGWTYVNMDDGWQGSRGGPGNALEPDPSKFKDIRAMVDQIHAMGLKVGIYHTPWVTSYGGIHKMGRRGGSADFADGTWIDDGKQHRYFGKFSFVRQDAMQFAAWGFDYLKYDWHPITKAETQAMQDALLASGRDIYFSLSNNIGHDDVAAIAPYANAWRTGGDITDSWQSMTSMAFKQATWNTFQSPGHINDPDMLVVGWVGWGHPRPTRLTPDEQYTHMTLWCMLSAPLLMGCDLTKLDAFTLGLLTNDELLALDQDALCRPADCVVATPDGRVYSKELEDGTRAVALVNLTAADTVMTLDWKQAGLTGRQRLRDLWRQRDIGVFEGAFSAKVPSHGVVLVRAAAP
jgi:alpha-galactosidase